MADQELQKPASAASAPEPVIHVIPEKFYGAALKQHAPKLPPTPLATATEKPPTSPAPGAPKKKRSVLVPVIIALIVLLLGGGAAAFFFLSKKPSPTVNVPVNAALTAPVCGDAKCDASESTATCVADCPAPVAVCGDAKCDSSEATATCAVDCPAPAAVCGDAKCDATESVAACPSDCRPPEPVPGADSDSDGLTDEEERSVYGTNPDDPNTDKDKYVDLNEVLSLFDPAKPEPAQLSDNNGIAAFTDAALGLAALRPAGWTVAVDAVAKSVAFSAQGGESVKVTVIAKQGTEKLSDWYRTTFPENASSAEPYRTRQGYEAIATADRQTVYVDGGDKVVSVVYGLGDRLEIQYKVTFQMIVQSLRLLGN